MNLNERDRIINFLFLNLFSPLSSIPLSFFAIIMFLTVIHIYKAKRVLKHVCMCVCLYIYLHAI